MSDTMSNLEAGDSISLVAAAELAIHNDDKDAAQFIRGALARRRKDLDQEYMLIDSTHARLGNFIVTGDPDEIPNVPESS